MFPCFIFSLKILGECYGYCGFHFTSVGYKLPERFVKSWPTFPEDEIGCFRGQAEFA